MQWALDYFFQGVGEWEKELVKDVKEWQVCHEKYLREHHLLKKSLAAVPGYEFQIESSSM